MKGVTSYAAVGSGSDCLSGRNSAMHLRRGLACGALPGPESAALLLAFEQMADLALDVVGGHACLQDLFGQLVDVASGAPRRHTQQLEDVLGRQVDPLDEDALRLLDHDPGRQSSS
jgi:predicted nucleotidyltransferase